MSFLHTVRSAFLEILAFSFCYLILFFQKSWKWKKYLSKRGIILVHGYLNNASALFYHGHQLSKAGFGPIRAVNLGNPFLSIEEYALRLKKKIEKMQQEFNLDEVVIIGHSMGGLVASYFALYLDDKKLVRRIISLGTPFQGTKVAKIGLGKCVKEMESNSPFLQKLLKDLMSQRQLRIDQVATSFDQIVIPYTSSLLDKELGSRYVLEDLGHAALLFSGRVNSKMVSWLL
ncbi:MAG: alpha/beta fold hydrolase [Parachlamydiales bacterium]|jgi:triacylglycerol lipase